MLTFILLVLQTDGCLKGTLFEDCPEYTSCLASASSCENLIVDSPSNFAGTLPSDIGLLTALVNLEVASFLLSGTIPSAIGLLTKLRSLNFGTGGHQSIKKGKLRGTIPTTIGNLTSLQSFTVYSMGISGSIPSTIGKLTRMETILLYGNELSGTLTKNFAALTKLMSLDVNNNAISGTIPPSFGALTELKLLDLGCTGEDSCNPFDGTLPPSLGKLTALKAMIIPGMNGTIPDTFASLQQLEKLELLHSSVRPSRKLYGNLSVLSKLVNLEYLGLARNAFNGTLDFIGELPRLTYLNVQKCELVGTIPAVLTRLTALQELNLEQNSLSGTIPDGISALSELEELIMHNNRISGTIPNAAFGALKQLHSLDLSFNQFSGSIPDMLKALQTLTFLRLADNYFTSVGAGICEIVEHLVDACDLSNNDIPGRWDPAGQQSNCPTCLNDGSCSLTVGGVYAPIFPNQVCNAEDCTCWASSVPTSASTAAPTAATPHHIFEYLFHIWNHIMLIVIICIVVCIALYELVVLPISACNEATVRHISYTHALRYAYTHQCACVAARCSRRGRVISRDDTALQIMDEGAALAATLLPPASEEDFGVGGARWIPPFTTLLAERFMASPGGNDEREGPSD